MSNLIESNEAARCEGAALLAQDKALLCKRRQLEQSSGCRGYSLSDFSIKLPRSAFLIDEAEDTAGGAVD